MRVIIHPSSLKGVLKAPASKSITQRAIAAATMAKGTSIIHNASLCDDAMSAINIAQDLGATVDITGDKFTITGNFSARETTLSAGESGLCMRMFVPIAALLDTPVTITGRGSLQHRPMQMIDEALSQLGASCKPMPDAEGTTWQIEGPLNGGNISIDGHETSQLLTGLLMALPLVAADSEICVKNLVSKGYVDMTIQLLRHFGVVIHKQNNELYKIKGRQRYNAKEYTVEGDWSAAAFLLVAAVLNGEITVQNLFSNTKQPDSGVLKVLTLAGAPVSVNEQEVFLRKPAGSPRAFNFDANESPDLVPPLVALAARCKGISTIYGINRLKIKESNRAEALQQEFARLGTRIELTDDTMKIYGGTLVVGNEPVYAHNDHRIAMALAIAACGANQPLTIEGVECVNKSYPDFFTDLKKLKISLTIEDN
ncbi:MAG: 3-phosphoshikimate 1-carboxyvinyltransferase [Prevotellaceae bacterium]|jgi:3-phosphoshikimate 1-carboxyvinyltransferase|nr:3-phosphoshikimate 1-carboxyvinyltransferase [Prevotellaceae bacterium]